MTSPENILDMNIARYRELIRTENAPSLRAELRAALERDLETKQTSKVAARLPSRPGAKPNP
jgi:hypothetical protein